MCQTWSAGKISLLPDSSFALVEIEKGKKVRHCPHHDANGTLDEEQLIYVLGNFDDEICEFRGQYTQFSPTSLPSRG